MTASIDTIIAAVPDMDADEVFDLCEALEAVVETIKKRYDGDRRVITES